MVRNKLALAVLSLVLMLLLSGCIPGDGANTKTNPAGFFWGIWHGWVAPISLIVGFFNRTFRIYEPLNTGWWYDLGFYAAIIGGFGGFSLARRRSR